MSETRLNRPITEDKLSNLISDILVLKPNRQRDFVAIWCDYAESVCKGVIIKAMSRATMKIQVVISSNQKLSVWVKEEASVSATIEIISMLLMKNILPAFTEQNGWQEKELEAEQEE